MDELLIARNPDPDSRLPYLLRLPLSGGMVFRTSGTWPRAKALYCYPVNGDEWPEDPEIVERVPIRSCVRRGAAIDLVLDRGRENRSQLCSPAGAAAKPCSGNAHAPASKPDRTSPPRPPGPPASSSWEIFVDTRERYGYRFTGQQARTVKRALPSGDNAVTVDAVVVAAVERKSLPDLVSSLINGTLRYALGELSALPRAAVVVEDRYSQVFKLDRIGPAVVADGLAELQVRWPGVPIVFCETRQLAEEWTYRYLAVPTPGPAARRPRSPASARPTPDPIWRNLIHSSRAPANYEHGRANGLAVADRGRLRPEILTAWRDANTP